MQLVAEVFIKSVRFKFVSLRKQPIIIYCYKSSFFFTTHKVTVETYGRNTTQELYWGTISTITLEATRTRIV